MKKALEKRGFQNIELMKNCKELQKLSFEELPHSFTEPYALCTFSRVMKGKGIENLINAIKKVNEKFGSVVFTLDIYGEVWKDYTHEFEALQKSLPEYIKYKGSVNYDKSVETLENYFALVFPTLFNTCLLYTSWQNYATFDEVGLAKKNLDAVNANILGAVLNGFDIKSTEKKNGYYYSYNYSYENADRWRIYIATFYLQ